MIDPAHELLPEVRAAGTTSVGHLFATVARLHPDRIALSAGGMARSYRELDRRVNRAARLFQARGLSRGDRIALLAHNCIEYLEVELAAAKLGVITAALNWRLAERELAHCVRLADPKLIVSQAEFQDLLAGRAGAGLPVITFGDEYEKAMSLQSSESAQVDVHPEDGMLIIYTSGTTGLPKGALLSHRAMIARALIYASELGAAPDANYVAWAPLFHMASSDFGHATLMRGGTTFVVDGYVPEELVDILSANAVHYFPVIPGMVKEFIEVLEGTRARPKGITVCGAMADLMPRHQIARITELLAAPFLNSFGSTETGIAPATANVFSVGELPADLAKQQSNFCQVRLVDENDRDVADGQPGELLIRGPSLFSGYWRNDEANAESFRDGWFHMGDAFRRQPDGRLQFVDRVKYMIKSGGENIYPAEIEQVVLADPRVAEAAVVRRPDPRWGEVPVLFAARLDVGLGADELIAMCRGELAGYKLPKAVHFIELDEFPRSTSGKIERHVLEARPEVASHGATAG